MKFNYIYRINIDNEKQSIRLQGTLHKKYGKELLIQKLFTKKFNEIYKEINEKLGVLKQDIMNYEKKINVCCDYIIKF